MRLRRVYVYNRRPRLSPTLRAVFLLLSAAAVVLSAPALALTSHVRLTSSEAPRGRLYLDPDRINFQATKDKQSPDYAVLAPLRNAPTAAWFTGDGNVQPAVSALVKRAEKAGAVPTLVTYNIPKRDCGEYSRNSNVSAARYRWWTRNFVRGLGDARAIVIVEPDALHLTSCLSPAELRSRIALLRYQVELLHKQGSWIYLDTGVISYKPWGLRMMADRLRAAGISHATGFAVNVASFESTDRMIRYGTALSQQTSGKHFIIDTSRNGRRQVEHTWCNPSGSGLGRRPTFRTGVDRVDAFLWVKVPGTSDGECDGAPPAGGWDQDYAKMLARNAH